MDSNQGPQKSPFKNKEENIENHHPPTTSSVTSIQQILEKVEQQNDRMAKLEAMLDKDQLDEMNLGQIGAQEMDRLLDKIIDQNQKALQQCDQLDDYLEKVKAQLQS